MAGDERVGEEVHEWAPGAPKPTMPPARRRRTDAIVAGGLVVTLTLAVAGWAGLSAWSGQPAPTSSNAAVVPTPTPRPTPRPSDTPRPTPVSTASPPPAIAARTDPNLVALATDPAEMVLAIGDRLLVLGRDTGMYSGKTNPVAYDPATQAIYSLDFPTTGRLDQFVTIGTIVTAVATAKSGVQRIVIEDVASGAVRTAPVPTGTWIGLYGIAEGWVFGDVFAAPTATSGSGPSVGSRAVVVDLERGTLTDVSPPGLPKTSEADVEVVDAGRALVARFDGTPDARTLTSVELVDLVSLARTNVRLDLTRIAPSGVWLDGELRLDGDLLVGGVTGGADLGHSFVANLATGAFDVVPLPSGIHIGNCPFWFDGSRLVCQGLVSADRPLSSATLAGPVFLYDVVRHATSSIATPGLSGNIWPRGVSDGRVVLVDEEHEPLVVVPASGAVYRLAGWDLSTAPFGPSPAIVGTVVIPSFSEPLDPRVWPLP